MTKPKPKEEHAPMGAPSKYKPEYCSTIIKFMKKGHSVLGFAGSIGVCRDSIYEWAKTYPDFSDALKAANAAAVLFWERLLLKMAVGGKGNITAIIFALKNRGREEWADVISAELTGKNGKPLNPETTPFTMLEIARRIALLMTQGDRAMMVLAAPPAPKPPQPTLQ